MHNLPWVGKPRDAVTKQDPQGSCSKSQPFVPNSKAAPFSLFTTKYKRANKADALLKQVNLKQDEKRMKALERALMLKWEQRLKGGDTRGVIGAADPEVWFYFGCN